MPVACPSGVARVLYLTQPAYQLRQELGLKRCLYRVSFIGGDGVNRDG